MAILHHSVVPQSWGKEQTITNIKNSHDGVVPYHVVIGKDWTYTDPNQKEVKLHAGNYPVNLVSVAVCMNGNFVTDTPTPYQREQLKKTLKGWMGQYSITRANIKLHREVRLKPTACPGKLDQNFISLLLTPTMTCEQQLEEEKAAHRETLERERTNYNNWQTEIEKRKQVETALTEEKNNHAESIAEKIKNAAERDAALEKLRQIKTIADS